MNRGYKTFSVFGQIEAVVAEAMAKEGKAHIIPIKLFPDERFCPEVWRNPSGELAKFAVQLDRTQQAEFDRRVKELRK